MPLTTQKDGASTPARPAEFTTGQGVASHPVACALKVGSHSFSFQAQFIPILMGRTTGRASGIIFPLSGPVRANVSTDHQPASGRSRHARPADPDGGARIMDMQAALNVAARKARTDPREVIQHLDAVSRERALTDQESYELERAIKQVDRLNDRSRNTIWTERLDNRLIALRRDGAPFALCAEALGVSLKAAQNRFYKLNGAGA